MYLLPKAQVEETHPVSMKYCMVMRRGIVVLFESEMEVVR